MTYAWRGWPTPQAEPEKAPDAEAIIAHHENQRALESHRDAVRKLVTDAQTDPKIVETCRAAAWFRAGHAVACVPTAVGDGCGWDFDPKSVPEGWPPGVPDPVAYVREQLSQRGIKYAD